MQTEQVYICVGSLVYKMWLVLTLTVGGQIPNPFQEKCCDTLELSLPDKFTYGDASNSYEIDFSTLPRRYKFYDAKDVLEEQCAGLNCPPEVLNMPGYFLIATSAYEDWDMFKPELLFSMINPNIWAVFGESKAREWMYNYTQLYYEKTGDSKIISNETRKKNDKEYMLFSDDFAELPLDPSFVSASEFTDKESKNFEFYNYDDDGVYNDGENYAGFFPNHNQLILLVDRVCGSSQISVYGYDSTLEESIIPNASLRCQSSDSSTLSGGAIAGITIGVLFALGLTILAINKLRNQNVAMDHNLL